MLPDWLFSSRLERSLQAQINREQELNRWLRDRVEQLQDRLAEAKNPGITARVEAPKRQAAREHERTIAEVVVAKATGEEDFGPMPGLEPD
jgi:hypothetical protein